LKTILSPWHPFGHTFGIFSVPSFLWVTRSAYYQSLASYWSHVRHILSPWHPIGHMLGIFSVPGFLLVTRSESSQLLASYWSHVRNLFRLWRPIGHTFGMAFTIQKIHLNTPLQNSCWMTEGPLEIESKLQTNRFMESENANWSSHIFSAFGKTGKCWRRGGNQAWCAFSTCRAARCCGSLKATPEPSVRCAYYSTRV